VSGNFWFGISVAVLITLWFWITVWWIISV